MKTINEYARTIFGKSTSELDDAERHVLERAALRSPVATDVNAEIAAGDTIGDRLADSIARVGGSWAFIIGFLVFLAAWALANTILLTRDAFDPYPFIFLNLVLSMVAALQAPVIMMSQNRQSERDRFAASKDYEVNLKAEVELLALHHKVDMLVAAEISQLREDVQRISSNIELLSAEIRNRQ